MRNIRLQGVALFALLSLTMGLFGWSTVSAQETGATPVPEEAHSSGDDPVEWPTLQTSAIVLDVVAGGTVTGNVSDVTAGGVAPYMFGIQAPSQQGDFQLDGYSGWFTYTAYAGASGTDTIVWDVMDSGVGSNGSSIQSNTITFAIFAAEVPEPPRDVLAAARIRLVVTAGEDVSGSFSSSASGGLLPYLYAVSSSSSMGNLTFDLNSGDFTFHSFAHSEGSELMNWSLTDTPSTLGGEVGAANNILEIVVVAQPDRLVVRDPGDAGTGSDDPPILGDPQEPEDGSGGSEPGVSAPALPDTDGTSALTGADTSAITSLPNTGSGVERHSPLSGISVLLGCALVALGGLARFGRRA